MQHLCEGITAAPARSICTRMGRNEIDGFHFCSTHFRIYNQARERHGPRPPNRCHVISQRHNYCPFNCVEDDFVCQRHLPPDEGGPQQQARLLVGWNPEDLAELIVDPNIFVVGFEDLNIPAELLAVPQVPQVLAFADDAQNVHRKEVSEQTNKAVEFLFKLKPPAEQETERDISVSFLTMAGKFVYGQYLEVMNDIHKWFHTKDCRENGDRFYFRILRSLVFFIKQSEHENELWKRLWQECSESVGMCCDGHISRLCNVLVGYVEGIGPQVSLGELTQQKMAAIAAQDIPEADKRKQANEFFNEHKVPHAERDAWLDAF